MQAIYKGEDKMIKRLSDRIKLLQEINSADKHTQKLIYNALHAEFYLATTEKPINKRKRFGRRSKYTNAQKQKALELRSEGYSAKQIYTRTGIKAKSQHWIIKKYKEKIDKIPQSIQTY